VLILEDNPRDAKLDSGRARKRRIPRPVRGHGLTGIIPGGNWKPAEYDVILADFNLRDWTAFDALEALNRNQERTFRSLW
jgi:hypothetical protein